MNGVWAMQGNLIPVSSETHTVVLQLASITGVPSSCLNTIRSPCGHYRPVRTRTARAVLVHLPQCRPGPGGTPPLVTTCGDVFWLVPAIGVCSCGRDIPRNRYTQLSVVSAAKFLGSAASIKTSSAGGRGDQSTWAFDSHANTLVLRFAKASPLSRSRVTYDEHHLRQLFMYVECTYSHTALKEELEPGYVH